MDSGLRLKTLRKRAGMTQQQVADQLGVTKSVISFYELKERSPSPDILVKYAKMFHVSTDYLLGLEKGKILDVSDLSEDEFHAVKTVVDTFKKNKENK